MKYILTTILNCKYCPYYFVFEGDRGDEHYCSQLSREDGYITDLSSVLSSCPLNDVTNVTNVTSEVRDMLDEESEQAKVTEQAKMAKANKPLVQPTLF